MNRNVFDLQETINKIRKNICTVNNRIKLINETRLEDNILHFLSKDLAKLLSLYFTMVFDNKTLHAWYVEGLFLQLQPYCDMVGFQFDKDMLLSQKNLRLDKVAETLRIMVDFTRSSLTINESSSTHTSKCLTVMYVLTNIFDSFL